MFDQGKKKSITQQYQEGNRDITRVYINIKKIIEQYKNFMPMKLKI